jgi:hypothetical protein
MRKLIILLFIIVAQTATTSGQENVTATGREIFPERSDTSKFKPYHDTGIQVGTSFMTNLKGGYASETYISPRINFQPSKSWRIDMNATISSLNFHNMTLYDYFNGFSGLTGINRYFEYYGLGTYKVNDKIYLRTAGYANNLSNQMQMMTGFENKMNFGGSGFVGYKFSDKFSMQAGFSILRNNDPWNMNQPRNNGGF